MAEQAGFEVKRPEADKGQFFPLVLSFQVGDAPLVERVTGLDWPAFVNRLPDEDTDPGMAEDLVAMAGLFAIAVAHARPTWRRDRIVDYVTGVELEHLNFHTGEDDEEVDERPPVEAGAGAISSESSPPPSSDTQASPSDPSSPTSSGPPPSDTGSA